ncbi:MAG: bile acid:sodium symporter family protein [Polymorphobacter sp.]|uniref:bile acid:sodium symporter family protein n=1 Tax=Polymorphobacter sp. TaxID=1909290 RepID=UPI003A84071F
MDPASILKLAIVGSIVLIVLAIGLSAPPGSIRAGFRDPGAILRAMLAMFVALPAVALGVSWLLPLDPPVRVGLLALAVSPMPPILPAKEQKLGGGLDYALAIQMAASVTALVAAPLLILISAAIFGREAGFDALAMARTILITIVAPLTAGIAIAAVVPALAARLARPARLAGMAMLAVGLVIVIWKAWPGIVAAATSVTLVAIALITLAGLAIGHALGGPEAGNRHALAVATASRHPGVAIGLAAAASLEPRQPIVAIVLLYLLAGALLTAPYGRWAKGRA